MDGQFATESEERRSGMRSPRALDPLRPAVAQFDPYSRSDREEWANHEGKPL